MSKPRRSNLAQVAATVRSRTSEVAGMPVEFRRKLVADLCKLLGDPSSTVSDTKKSAPAPANGATKIASSVTPQTADAEPPLPPRLRQTLDYLLTGDSEKQIARKLSLSQHTVHVYVKSLYRKFDVSSRGELLARWVKR